MNNTDERAYKVERILEEYDKRKTQAEVADMFMMDVKHVSQVTQMHNYRHTRKITLENRRDTEYIKPLICYDDLWFLDQYPIQNFMK